VLIYFALELQGRVLDKLLRSLDSNAVKFTGAGEIGKRGQVHFA